MFNKIVGAQLVRLDEKGFEVKKGDNLYHFDFIEDEGDCCGFNEISTQLFISEEELTRNPAIMRYEVVEDDDFEEGSLFRLVFFGEVKKMAEVETYSSSGSGWSYGATVSCLCRETNEEKVLSSW
jgi:hypothetical protein